MVPLQFYTADIGLAPRRTFAALPVAVPRECVHVPLWVASASRAGSDPNNPSVRRVACRNDTVASGTGGSCTASAPPQGNRGGIFRGFAGMLRARQCVPAMSVFDSPVPIEAPVDGRGA